MATFLWNRQTDEFELGQWLKGRIYERRCDLSPDGKYLVYFAMNGKWNEEARGAWTAISVAPYLRALALFPQGHCYFGGGLWVNATSYWLNGSPDVLRNTDSVQRDLNFKPKGSVGSECLSVYFPRLLRDGWRLVSTPGQNIVTFEKELTHDWVLRKLCHAQIHSPVGKGCYWDEHFLANVHTHTLIPLASWEWADVDRNRLVWAEQGMLKAAKIGPDGLEEVATLFDFNPCQFEERIAPY